MNEYEATDDPGPNWYAGWTWGIASFLVNLVLTSGLAFLLGDHAMSDAEIFGFSVAAGVINGVTFSHFTLPLGRLTFEHWLVAAAIGAAIAYAGMLFIGSSALLGASTAFSGAFTMMGLPMGYFVMKTWVSRSVTPKGHPDNIPD